MKGCRWIDWGNARSIARLDGLVAPDRDLFEPRDVTEACEEVVLDNPESKDCWTRGRIVAARGVVSPSRPLIPSSIDPVFLRRLGCGSGVGYDRSQVSSGARRLALALGGPGSAAILGES